MPDFGFQTNSHPVPDAVCVAGPYPGYPAKVMGMYILLADDTEEGSVCFFLTLLLRGSFYPHL